MIPTLALALLLQVQPTDPARNPGSFINIERRTAQAVVVEETDHPKPKRSTAWVMLGGYGMAAFGAGIGGIIGDAVSRNDIAEMKNTHAGNRAMAIGALVGLVPGLIFGNEARLEQNSLARSVLLVLSAGGTLALVAGWSQTHSRLTF